MIEQTLRSKLRPNCLSFPEVLAQSVALIAPTITPATNIPLVFASAGNGTWLSYVIAVVGLLLVSFNLNQFARRSASAGSLYTSVARGLGSTPGFLCGWALVLGYLATAMATITGFSHYTNLVLQEFGLQLPSILLFTICAGIVWYYAYTDIQLSTILMLIIELVAVGVVLSLGLFIFVKQGLPLDIPQLTLVDTTPSGISLGVVIAILSFIGFESAATLGDEAKQPTQFIPRALIWSAALTGVFFVLLAYIEILSFRSFETPLNQAIAPLSVLADVAGLDLLGVGINVGIMFSFFGCFLACVNAGARIAFSLARYGIFPSPLAKAHLQNETPYVAVSLTVLIVFLIPASLSLFGLADLEIYSYAGTIAAYGLLVAYILASIAAPFYLARRGQLRLRHRVISLLAVGFMAIPVVGSIYPAPAFPFNLFPYLFLLYLLAGAGLFLALRGRSPQIGENLERDF